MITREFKLYLNAGVGVAPVINANQFDQDEEWIFTLLKSDGTVYTPSTGAIIGLKQDGTTILNAGTVNSSGQVVITETEQMTAVPGSNLFEILIDGNTHGTANFVVFVERRPGDIDNPSESDISLFQEAIEAAGNVTQFQADISALQSGLATTNANLTSEANTRASADATLQSNISTEASTRQTQDAVLQAEIDQIIAPSGEAPSAAEVQNARIGVDGTTYDTLGNAIRTQVGDLKNAISNLENMQTEAVLPGSYENGSLNTDGIPYSSGYDYRVRSSAFVPTSAVTVNIAEGFKTYWHYYSDQSGTMASHKASSGWVTESYTIQTTYPYYKVVIARVTEVSSETADVAEFSESLTVNINNVLIETVNSNTLRIEQLERGSLPDYWLTYLERKAEALTTEKANIGNHGDYFTFFTDYHAPQNKEYTADILRYINKHAEVGFNICGGDILTTHTKTEAISVLSAFQSEFEGLDLFNLQGNHEQNPYASNGADKLNNWEYYPFLFKNEERNPAVSMTKYGYYYLDNDAQKIRYIFLNTKYSVTQFSIDTTQGNWFVSVLNSVPEGYGVVVLTHWFFGTVNADYTLTIDGIGTRIKEICDGYAERTTGTSVGIEPAYNVQFDFTNAKGNMICVICGHTHNDYSIMSDAGYPIIACMCDAYQGSRQNPAYPRTVNTVNEQAIDVFFIDTATKTVKTIRIGAGESTRSWSYY